MDRPSSSRLLEDCKNPQTPLCNQCPWQIDYLDMVLRWPARRVAIPSAMLVDTGPSVDKDQSTPGDSQESSA